MKSSRVLLSAVLAVCCATTAWGANSVVVESKDVAAGATGVTIGVYLENDVSLSFITVPLEFRGASGNAFITNSLSASANGRLLINMAWMTPWEKAEPSPVNDCSGPLSRSWGSGTQVDFVDPDAVALRTIANPSPFDCLTPGSDGIPPSGTPSMILTFDVAAASGIFVIDTCCFSPNNSPVFNDCSFDAFRVPYSFTKGIVTVGDAGVCNDRPVDVNCDGLADILDMATVSSVIFYGAPEPGACCNPSGRCNDRPVDVNCDGVIDILDMVSVSRVIYYGQPEPDPCCNQ